MADQDQKRAVKAASQDGGAARAGESEKTKKPAAEDEVVGKAYDSRLMRRLVGYLKPYKLQTAVSAGAILLKAGSDVIGPYLVKVAVDNYLSGERNAHPSWLARHLSSNAMTGITEVAGLYLGALVLTFALEFLQTYLMQWTGQKIMFDLRKEIFRHIQRMQPAFFDRNPVGKLVTRVTSDVDALNEMFTSGVLAIFGGRLRPDLYRADHVADELAAGAPDPGGAARDPLRNQRLSAACAGELSQDPVGDLAH